MRVIALPHFIHMPSARLHAPFDHAEWLFELKYDGFRSRMLKPAPRACSPAGVA
jgi:ATP-dependent DNA ligase